MKKNNLIGLLIGIIAGILIGIALLPRISQAKSTQTINTETAAKWVIKHYDEYHIHPVTATAILNGESGAMTAKNNHGRPYGMIGQRYYDLIEGTKAFCELIRHSGYYGDAWKYNDYQSQLSEIAGHGYCVGSGYLNYLHQIISTYNLERFEKDLKDYQEEQRNLETKRHEAEVKNRLQEGEFTLIYDSTLAPWQIETDKDIIGSGTILIGYNWCDVVKTRQGLGNIIRTGDRTAMTGRRVKLDDIVEGAVG